MAVIVGRQYAAIRNAENPGRKEEVDKAGAAAEMKSAKRSDSLFCVVF